MQLDFLILPYMNDTILKRVEHKLLLALSPPPLKKSVLTLRQIENKYILLRTDWLIDSFICIR